MHRRVILVCGAFVLLMGVLFILSPRSGSEAAQWSFFWQETGLKGHLSVGFAAGGLWAVAGLLLLAAGVFSIDRLLAARGVILTIAALTIPVFLFFKVFHVWYWRPLFPAMFAATQGFAFMGAVWLGQDIPMKQNRSRVLRLVEFAAIGVAAVLTIAQLPLISLAYNYAIPNPPDNYSGDYLVLGVHLKALQAGALVWLIAGFTLGWRQQR